jgi:hypothetical protein
LIDDDGTKREKNGWRILNATDGPISDVVATTERQTLYPYPLPFHDLPLLAVTRFISFIGRKPKSSKFIITLIILS